MNTFPRTGYHGSSGYMYAKHFDRFLSCFPGTHFIQPIGNNNNNKKKRQLGANFLFLGSRNSTAVHTLASH